MAKYQFAAFILMILLVSPSSATQNSTPAYSPDTGDKAFDESLQRISKKFEKTSPAKISRFSEKLSEAFQIPQHSVEELFDIYEFTAADVLLSVSIADVSGEPLKSAAGLYFNNKKQGWKAVLKQLKIYKGSKVYEDAVNLKQA